MAQDGEDLRDQAKFRRPTRPLGRRIKRLPLRHRFDVAVRVFRGDHVGKPLPCTVGSFHEKPGPLATTAVDQCDGRSTAPPLVKGCKSLFHVAWATVIRQRSGDGEEHAVATKTTITLLTGSETLRYNGRVTDLNSQANILHSRKRMAGKVFSDREMMRRAIDLARKCISEEGKVFRKLER